MHVLIHSLESAGAASHPYKPRWPYLNTLIRSCTQTHKTFHPPERSAIDNLDETGIGGWKGQIHDHSHFMLRCRFIPARASMALSKYVSCAPCARARPTCQIFGLESLLPVFHRFESPMPMQYLVLIYKVSEGLVEEW